MIYALVGSDASESDRQAIAQAIISRDAPVLAQYVSQDIIRHIMDIADSEEYHCIWCLCRVSPSSRNGPRGHQPANRWLFWHTGNGECIGQRVQIGANPYCNPPHHGCYVQMGCEHVPHRSRQECQCICISTGQTYCHHASNPGAGGGSCV